MQTTGRGKNSQMPAHSAIAEFAERGGVGSVLLWEGEVKCKKGIDKGGCIV